MLNQLHHIWQTPVLRMLCLAVFLFGAHVSTIGPYQSLVAITVFGLSDAAYALLLMVALAVGVGAAVGIGILTDQRPSRWLMALLASVAMTSGALIVWLGNTPAAFVLAHALLLPVSASLLGQIFAVARLVLAPLPAQDRDGIIAIIRSFFALPFVTVLPLWGLALAGEVPLLRLYPALAAFGGLTLLLVLRGWPRDAAAPWVEQKSGLGFRSALAEMLAPTIVGRVMLIGAIHLGGALAGAVTGLIFAGAGHGPGAVGLFFGLFVAVEIMTSLNAFRLLAYLRRLHVIALGTFIYAAFLILLPVLAPGDAVWLLVLPAGIGGGFIYALAIGYLQDLMGARAGAGASLLALQRIASDGLAALTFGFGTWASGYGLVPVLGGILMGLAVSWLMWLDRARPAS
ncbi:MAG: hypothetical protein GW886_10260 [Rhodobacterales bacterium]|nr:hypothetical protein [Rhodobacterales bacterium]NCT12804.1 hypothetical protein [Rhodobacterales bacterium]